MKRKSDFVVEIIVNGQHYDITKFVISYKFQGGPEQPIRYFEMEVSKKTIDKEYPSLIDGLVDDNGVIVGSTYIYVDAVGHGTFTLTKLWLEDYIYEFTALGVENTLNTSITPDLLSSGYVNPAQTAYGLFNSWKSMLTINDTFDMWFSKTFATVDATKPDGYDHSLPNADTSPNTDTTGRFPILFKEGLPMMVALSLCALMDDAFVFFANGEVNGSMVNRLYYVRYGDDLPLASNPGMPNQNGVINIYPDMRSEYETYTQFDYMMAKKMAGMSSKNGEGSETITNVQKVTCSSLDGTGSESETISGEYSIAKYGESASPTIISEYICTNRPDIIAVNTIRRYEDPTRSIVFNMVESASDSNGAVGWEETIPAYSYAYAINDNVNDIHLVNKHTCEPDTIDGQPNPYKTDNALLRMSTYIRSYPDMVTEYTFGVMKDTTMAQEITSSLTGSMGARIGEEDVGTPSMPIYLDQGVPKPATTLVTSILQAVYPVDSIYISVNPTNPQILFGFGTWEAFGAGRTLVGIDTSENPDSDFDTVEKTGGEKTHTLTTSEMPSHGHGVQGGGWGKISSVQFDPSSAPISDRDATDYSPAGSGTVSVGSRKDYFTKSNTGSTFMGSADVTINNHTHTLDSAGGDGAHNNLQPYIVTYMWKRTA